MIIGRSGNRSQWGTLGRGGAVKLYYFPLFSIKHMGLSQRSLMTSHRTDIYLSLTTMALGRGGSRDSTQWLIRCGVTAGGDTFPGLYWMDAASSVAVVGLAYWGSGAALIMWTWYSSGGSMPNLGGNWDPRPIYCRACHRGVPSQGKVPRLCTSTGVPYYYWYIFSPSEQVVKGLACTSMRHRSGIPPTPAPYT